MKPPQIELEPYVNDISGAAEKFRVTTRTIRKWLAKYGIYCPRESYQRRINMMERQEIRRLYFKEEWTQQEIAGHFEISQTSVGNIVNKDLGLSFGGEAMVSWKK